MRSAPAVYHMCLNMSTVWCLLQRHHLKSTLGTTLVGVKEQPPMISHDEALARAMREEHERMASEPPLFTKEQLGGGGGGAASSSLDMATLLALIAFVGVVVTCPHTHFSPLSQPACKHSPLTRLTSGLLRGASTVESTSNLLCRTERRTRAACQRRDHEARGPQANGKSRLTLCPRTIMLV